MDLTSYQYAKLKALEGIQMHLHNIDNSLQKLNERHNTNVFNMDAVTPPPKSDPIPIYTEPPKDWDGATPYRGQRKVDPNGNSWVCKAASGGESQWKKEEGYGSYL